MDTIVEKVLKFLRLDTLIDSLSGYVETRVELVKMEIREEVAGILSRGLMMMILFLLAFLCILFAMLGLALYLNTVTESVHAGYWLVAGVFGLLLTILLIGRKSFFKAMGKQFEEMIKHRQH